MEKSSEKAANDFERRYKMTAAIILSQVFVVLILLGVAWFLAPSIDIPATPAAVTAFWVLIVAGVVAVFILRRFLFSWKRVKQNAVSKGIRASIATLQADTILLGTLCEVIAIIGFILAAVTGDKFEMFRAGAVSLVAFLMVFPRKMAWKQIIVTLEAQLKG